MQGELIMGYIKMDYINEEAVKKKKNRAFLTIALIFVCMPATIYGGILLLDDRKYFFISILLVIESMIPFFMAFESRRPQARELVVIAVLTAIAVAGRAAFFMVPQFKPVIAIVIIAGVCFGGETGFLVGAMAAFVSGFFFGQGPFVPWQMFSIGVIGFLAGILVQKKVLKKTVKTLTVFGGLSAFFIYGGIMDLCSIMMWTQEITWELVAATYTAGLMFNLIHAGATIVFLLLLTKPMIEKLERIKIKYGLFLL
jgi:energy-coupling factor transport system substrate-specific component